MPGDTYDVYQGTVTRLEPEIAHIDASAFYASSAISLKRLADEVPKLRQEANAYFMFLLLFGASVYIHLIHAPLWLDGSMLGLLVGGAAARFAVSTWHAISLARLSVQKVRLEIERKRFT